MNQLRLARAAEPLVELETRQCVRLACRIWGKKIKLVGVSLQGPEAGQVLVSRTARISISSCARHMPFITLTLTPGHPGSPLHKAWGDLQLPPQEREFVHSRASGDWSVLDKCCSHLVVSFQCLASDLILVMGDSTIVNAIAFDTDRVILMSIDMLFLLCQAITLKTS
ncbi:hypothetical protein PAXRUDRAFT_508522 [Paxillus rubicundulus Ve08.2h10]|uniref:Uncharacterized protein n=1 Tax=Paxillus rubicundulus Ve08.2h10 TaxID=930991 RepID=A0A0D0E6W0_9AGAM|nr:hypothetical protein PAXRUDRAFT_508522 [Paxillus rubicundulus Ve08.2h10]